MTPDPAHSVTADPLAMAWLNHLVGVAEYLAVGVRHPNGKKSFYPTLIRDEDDRRALIEDHLLGRLPSRLCQRDGETFYAEHPFALGYYTTQRLGSRFVTNALVFDIDGPGHADGLTPEQVEERTWAIAGILEEAGLAPTVVRSNSAAGRHIITTLAEPIDAGLAVFIAQGVLALIPGAEKTEFFPRTATLRDGQFGRLVAMPLNGAAPAVGGGRIIDRAGNELSAASVCIPDQEVITAVQRAFEHQQAAEMTIRTARRAEGQMMSHLAYASGGDTSWSLATLEQVVRAFAKIADDRVTEPDIIGIHCPTHDGTCFHVNVDQGWFCCHNCTNNKGAGPGAPFMLLRLLRPSWSHSQIRAELKALAAKTGAAS